MARPNPAFTPSTRRHHSIAEIANQAANIQARIDYARQRMRNNGLQMQQLHFQQQALQEEAKLTQANQLQQQIDDLAVRNRPLQNDEQRLLQQKQTQANTLRLLVSSMADYELSALFRTNNVTPHAAAEIFACLQDGYTAPVTGIRRIGRFIFGTAIDKDTKFKLLLDDSIPLAKRQAMFAAVPVGEQIKYLLRLNHEQQNILTKQLLNASANKNPPQTASVLMHIKQRFSKIIDAAQLFKQIDDVNIRSQIFSIVADHDHQFAVQMLHKDAVNKPQDRASLLGSINLDAPNGKANAQFIFNTLDKNRGYSSSAKIEVLNLLATNRQLQNILIAGLHYLEAAEIFTTRAIGVDLNHKLNLYNALATSNPESAMQVIAMAKNKNGMIFTGTNSHAFFKEFANVHLNNIALLVQCLRKLQPDATQYLSDIPQQQRVAVGAALRSRVINAQHQTASHVRLQNPVAASATSRVATNTRAQGYGSVLSATGLNNRNRAAATPQSHPQTPAPTGNAVVTIATPARPVAGADNSKCDNKHSAAPPPFHHLDSKHSHQPPATDATNPVPSVDSNRFEEEKSREQAVRGIRPLTM